MPSESNCLHLQNQSAAFKTSISISKAKATMVRAEQMTIWTVGLDKWFSTLFMQRPILQTNLT